MLLELPDGSFGLIDFHYDTNYSIEPPGLSYLKYLHDSRRKVVISFICISHPDRDHTKGVFDTLSWIEEKNVFVDKLWLYPGIDKPDINAALPDSGRKHELNRDLSKLATFIEESWHGTSPDYLQGVRHLDTLKGPIDVCVLGPLGSHVKKVDRVTMRIAFLPNDKRQKPRFPSGNLVSSIIKMKFAEHQLLFGGDTGGRIWRECLDEYDHKHQHGTGPCKSSCRSNFIKISHHGARSSSTLNLWRRTLAVSANVAISAGSRKSPLHPHPRTLVQILRTSDLIGSRETKILSTNQCERCVSSSKLPRVKVPGISLTPPQPKKKLVNRALEQVKPDTSKSPGNRLVHQALKAARPKPSNVVQSKTPTLAAYIYRFTPGREVPQVKRAMKTSFHKQHCVYGNKGKKRFPYCATD